MYHSDELALWATIVLESGYPRWLLANYLMTEFAIGYELAADVAGLAARWADYRSPLIE